MILLFGYGDDPAITMTAEALANDDAEHLLIDQLRCPDIDLCLGPDARLEGSGWRLPLADVSAAYARPLAPIRRGDDGSDARGAALADLMNEWLDSCDARVVSRPSDMASNSSKPYQAQLVAEAGFAVPATLITNDPDAVREFAAEHDAVVFKSISGVRSIVQRLEGRFERRLDRVEVLPTQFQAYVPGTDVRVHVVDNDVFPTEVISDATDYRYASREGREAELNATTVPDDVAEQCVALARSLNLPLAGIDLRRPAPDANADEYTCFEVNPMPGFSYYEANTGQPISVALARYLAFSS